jgi:lysophospholipase L1-like esterase
MRWPAVRLVAGAMAGAIAIASCARQSVERHRESTHWIATWQGPPQLTEPRNLPPAPGLAGRTLRQRVRVSLGGSRWRLRFSNEFGDGPLTISAAHVARSAGGEGVDSASGVALRFRGSPSVTIAAGAAVLSDEIALAVEPLTDLAVSLYIATMPAAVTGHPGSRTTSYLLAGEHVAERTLAGAVPVEHWYVLSGAEVVAPSESRAVVVLGNSIADGRGSGTDRSNRWPDNLARRLHEDPRTRGVAVLNAGIGGNAVIRGGLGPPALERLERDVLAQRGVRWLIISDGVNDIGNALAPETARAIGAELIAAYREITRRARARGIRVYGATMLPFAGSQYGSAEHERARQQLNAWIRTSGELDAVIDFDLAMRDPSDLTRLLPAVDGGDHLHPNEAGYRAMADAIDLGLFAGASR